MYLTFSNRTTAVFAFESALGIHKRWNSLHKNGKSEGSSMLKQFWGETLASTIITVNAPSFKMKRGKKVKEGVVKLDDEFYYVQNENWSEAYEISSVQFDEELLFFTFQLSCISLHAVSIPLSSICEIWSVVRIQNSFFIYDCVFL
jgi:hypothetical protein